MNRYYQEHKNVMCALCALLNARHEGKDLQRALDALEEACESIDGYPFVESPMGKAERKLCTAVWSFIHDKKEFQWDWMPMIAEAITEIHAIYEANEEPDEESDE